MNFFVSKLRSLIPFAGAVKDHPDAEQGAIAFDSRYAHYSRVEWTMDEVDIMLRSERDKVICYVTHQSAQRYAQTLILGMDLKNNLLLIDDLFPRLEGTTAEHTMHITIRTKLGSLAAMIQVVELIKLKDAPALLVKIIEKTPVDDRRLSDRTYFNGPTQPKISLLIPLVGNLKGTINDLSSGGFSMTYVSAQKPQLLGAQGSCSIEIDTHMRFDLAVTLKSIKACRKPFKHYVIRACFRELNEQHRDQLQLFVERHRLINTVEAA